MSFISIYITSRKAFIIIKLKKKKKNKKCLIGAHPGIDPGAGLRVRCANHKATRSDRAPSKLTIYIGHTSEYWQYSYSHTQYKLDNIAYCLNSPDLFLSVFGT